MKTEFFQILLTTGALTDASAFRFQPTSKRNPAFFDDPVDVPVELNALKTSRFNLGHVFNLNKFKNKVQNQNYNFYRDDAKAAVDQVSGANLLDILSTSSIPLRGKFDMSDVRHQAYHDRHNHEYLSANDPKHGAHHEHVDEGTGPKNYESHADYGHDAEYLGPQTLSRKYLGLDRTRQVLDHLDQKEDPKAKIVGTNDLVDYSWLR